MYKEIKKLIYKYKSDIQEISPYQFVIKNKNIFLSCCWFKRNGLELKIVFYEDKLTKNTLYFTNNFIDTIQKYIIFNYMKKLYKTNIKEENNYYLHLIKNHIKDLLKST